MPSDRTFACPDDNAPLDLSLKHEVKRGAEPDNDPVMKRRRTSSCICKNSVEGATCDSKRPFSESIGWNPFIAYPFGLSSGFPYAPQASLPSTDVPSNWPAVSNVGNRDVLPTSEEHTKQQRHEQVTPPGRTHSMNFRCSCGSAFPCLVTLSRHTNHTGHAPISASGPSEKAHPNAEPPKLARGQDVWTSSGTDQTDQILRCITCGLSFESLSDLTVHMIKTRHFSSIVGNDVTRKNSCTSRPLIDSFRFSTLNINAQKDGIKVLNLTSTRPNPLVRKAHVLHSNQSLPQSPPNNLSNAGIFPVKTAVIAPTNPLKAMEKLVITSTTHQTKRPVHKGTFHKQTAKIDPSSAIPVSSNATFHQNYNLNSQKSQDLTKVGDYNCSATDESDEKLELVKASSPIANLKRLVSNTHREANRVLSSFDPTDVTSCQSHEDHKHPSCSIKRYAMGGPCVWNSMVLAHEHMPNMVPYVQPDVSLLQLQRFVASQNLDSSARVNAECTRRAALNGSNIRPKKCPSYQEWFASRRPYRCYRSNCPPKLTHHATLHKVDSTTIERLNRFTKLAKKLTAVQDS